MKRDEQKTKAELIEELVELRSKFDAFLNGNYFQAADRFPQFVFEIDTEGQFRYTNTFALNNSDYSREDILKGLTLDDVIHPDDIDRARSNMTDVLAGKRTPGQEYKALRKDQSTFPIKIYSERVVLDGQPTGIRGVLIDMSGIKEAEEALRTSENYYRTLFENTGTAMVIIGPDSIIKSCNSQFALLSGCSQTEIEDKMKWSDFVAPTDLRRMTEYHTHRNLNDKVGPNNYEFTFLTHNNERKRIHVYVRLIPGTYDRVCSLIDETERHQALVDLQESEERYKLVGRGANDGIWDWNLITNAVYYSPRYRENLGYTEEEFPNNADSWLNSLHPDDREKAMQANKACAEGKVDHFQVEFRQIHKDGTIRWILGRGGSSKDKNGKVNRMAGTHTDITHRKQAEQALRESEERFRNMVEQATNGIYQSTLDGKVLTANTAIADMLGFDSPQDFIDNVENLAKDIWVHAEDRLEMCKQLHAKGELQNYEMLCKRKNGQLIWLFGNIRMVHDENRGLDYYEGFLHDVTDRKRNERTTQALYTISKAVSTTRNLKDLYQTIHTTIDGVIQAKNFFIAMLDAENDMLRFVYFQDEKDDYYDIPNISDQQQCSLSIQVFRTGEPLFLSKADPDIADRMNEIGTIGTQPAVWLGVPLKLGGNVVGTMAVQDYDNPNQYSDEAISFMTAVSEQVAMAIERKSIEEALTKLNEELESKVDQRTAELHSKTLKLEKANNRLLQLDKIKSAMVSSVSHELRTPLTSIRGFAKLCIRDFVRHFQSLATDDKIFIKGQRIKNNLEIIETEGERLTRLINDFLDINRIESGKTIWNDHFLDPCDVIRKATSTAAGGFRSNTEVKLITDLPESTHLIHADPDKIQQVLINLLNNAYKFTKEGTVTVSLKDGNDILTVSVQDTGSGIPPDEINYIFEKFHKSRLGDTVRSEEKGTGLGLAICKEIVEHYDGSIWVESIVHQGSTFTFSLPSVPGTEPIDS